MAKKGKIHGFETVNDIQRPSRIKKYKYLYLIVCEDENTERRYFQSFEARIPKETIYLKAVGTGLDPLGIVERAIKERKELSELCGRDIDVVWVVFDKDDADLNPTRIERFNRAFEIGNKENFNFAYSNEAFELWLLLHLTDIDPAAPLTRQFIYAELQRIIRTFAGHDNYVYVHGNANILDKIAELGDEQAAFERADHLIAINGGKDPIAANPVTYVGNLLKDLYEWIRYFGFI
jgi:hypothetical protein